MTVHSVIQSASAGMSCTLSGMSGCWAGVLPLGWVVAQNLGAVARCDLSEALGISKQFLFTNFSHCREEALDPGWGYHGDHSYRLVRKAAERVRGTSGHNDECASGRL